MQTIQYQVVTLLTTNGQAPFVTVFMYLSEAKDEQEKRDLAMVIEEVLEQRYQGVKNEKGVWVTPAFPKLVYVLEKDNIHPDAPLLLSNGAGGQMYGQAHGARLYLRKDHEAAEGGPKRGWPVLYLHGMPQLLTPYVDENGKPKYYGRFNQGVVTVNLVDIGLSAGKDMDKFWEIFDERMELCHQCAAMQARAPDRDGSDVAPIFVAVRRAGPPGKGRKEDRQIAARRVFHHFAGLCGPVGMRIQHDRQKADRAGGRGFRAGDHAQAQRIYRQMEKGGEYRLQPVWHAAGKHDV